MAEWLNMGDVNFTEYGGTIVRETEYSGEWEFFHLQIADDGQKFAYHGTIVGIEDYKNEECIQSLAEAIKAEAIKASEEGRIAGSPFLELIKQGHTDVEALYITRPEMVVSELVENYGNAPFELSPVNHEGYGAYSMNLDDFMVTDIQLARFMERVGLHDFISDELKYEVYKEDWIRDNIDDITMTATEAAYENCEEAEDMTFEEYIEEYGFADGSCYLRFDAFQFAQFVENGEFEHISYPPTPVQRSEPEVINGWMKSDGMNFVSCGGSLIREGARSGEWEYMLLMITKRMGGQDKFAFIGTLSEDDLMRFKDSPDVALYAKDYDYSSVNELYENPARAAEAVIRSVDIFELSPMNYEGIRPLNNRHMEDYLITYEQLIKFMREEGMVGYISDELLYEGYKEGWLRDHISSDEMKQKKAEYEESEEVCFMSFNDYIEEFGFAGGMIYASFNEWMDSEHQNYEQSGTTEVKQAVEAKKTPSKGERD